MSAEQMIIEIKVEGMSCQHCAAAVKKAATSVPGVADAVVDLKAGVVTVHGDAFDRQKVVEAIDKAGYTAS